MSTRPVHRHELDMPRVQRTIRGISEALHGSRRAQFFAELLRAQQGQELMTSSTLGGAGQCSTPTRNGIASMQPQWTAPSPPRLSTRSVAADASVAPVSDDEADLWPVLLSEIVGDTLSDSDVSSALFSVVAALTVAVCENPWLEGSNSLEGDPDWREILIPDGHRIAEYRINRADHGVILTRIVIF